MESKSNITHLMRHKPWPRMSRGNALHRVFKRRRVFVVPRSAVRASNYRKAKSDRFTAQLRAKELPQLKHERVDLVGRVVNVAADANGAQAVLANRPEAKTTLSHPVDRLLH